MIPKSKVESVENEKIMAALNKMEQYLDDNLMVGCRSFTTSSVLGLSQLTSNYYPILVDGLIRIYKAGGWNVERTYGDQRDPYDNLNFS